MPLPLPRLDSRNFDQLVAEGMVLLPRHAPSWTDYNASDPGITLLELLAWLTEQDFYRLDRVPVQSYRAFLRLVGVEPRPAQVAETVVMAALAAPLTTMFVPAGTRVGSVAGGIAFQTAAETSFTAAKLVAVLSGKADDLLDHTATNFAGDSDFGVLGTADAGDAAYLGFDVALPSSTAPLSLHVSTGKDEQDRRERARLKAEWDAAHAEALGDSISMGTSEPPDWRQHYGARTVWEYYSGGTWVSFESVQDETRALTLSGLVRFTVPASRAHSAGGIPSPAQSGRFFIRCRLVSGRYDCVPRIRSVAINGIRVQHAVDSGAAHLAGISTGRAGQTFVLPAAPLVPGQTRVSVMVNGVAGAPWHEVPNWDRVGPHERAYVVCPERGEIAFGNGRTGRVPRAGAQLEVTYQVGGGPSGNVPTDTLTTPEGFTIPGVTLTQPYPARGGEAAETIDAAISRALAAQAASGRTITLQDFELHALAVPGTRVARAHAIADYDPSMPCLPALGSVTVVVVPHCPPARPEPSSELLCAVYRHLERRRTLTTELHVVGPCYAKVSVQARLHPTRGADTTKLGDAARAALDRYFDPLRGGPEGTGWPVGRDVYRAELLALLNDLPGVSYVDELSLSMDDQASSRCGNISVCRHGLVMSGRHQITIDSGSPCQ